MFTPFRPAVGRLDPAPTPALSADVITFGSFNHPAKLSLSALSGWAEAMRAVVAADFCNGTSAALDFRQWTFLNADLTVSMAREPVGEWILLDAESTIGPDGAGLAMARLADERGYFGRAVQSLVIERR